MKDDRGSWYLLTGLVLGLMIGLSCAWFIQPRPFSGISPAHLQTEDKEQYRALIASAYAANNDLVRAKARLDLLQDADMYAALAAQAQRYLEQGSFPDEARALGLLAIAIGEAEEGGGRSPGRPDAAAPAAASPTPVMIGD